MNEISSIATADAEDDEFDFPIPIITPTTATPLLAVIADCPIRTVRALEDALSLARTELATAQASLEVVKDVFRIRDELAILQCKVVINGDRINAAPSAHPTIDSVRQHAEAQELLDAHSVFDEKALHNLKAVDAMTLHSKLMATIMPGAAPADTNMARSIKWVLCQARRDSMKLDDDGQHVTVSAQDVWSVAYVSGLPLGSIKGWKIRLQLTGSNMQCHMCTRPDSYALFPYCTVHRCVTASGSTHFPTTSPSCVLHFIY